MSKGKKQKPSRTAEGCAVCRAMACYDEAFAHHTTDFIAKHFLNPVTVTLIKFSFFRNLIKRRFFTPGVYEYMIARTQHMDDLFIRALEENWPQVVMLGAGYDSRALRFHEKNNQTRIFEVDIGATQRLKKKYILDARLQWPSAAIFIEADLDRDQLDIKLNEAGYDKTARTLFFMEGLTMYLPRLVIERLVQFIHQNRAAETCVAFDYFFPSVVDGTSVAYGAKEQYEAVKKVGEPFQCGFEKGEIVKLLTHEGFEIQSHFMPEEFEQTYLIDRDGNRNGDMYRCSGNIVATRSMSLN